MAKAKKDTYVKPNSLEELVHRINKDHGNDAIVGQTAMAIEVIPTGIPSLDLALGCGGMPRGRIVEIFGPESGGKTTLTLTCAKACQQQEYNGRKGVVAIIDAEHALDTTWAENIGLDVSKLIINQPQHGEQAYDIVSALAKSGLVDMIIVDSVAALSPKAELDATLEGNSAIGAQARLNSQAMRKINGDVAAGNCCLLLINQIREKIGVLFGCLHADTLIKFVDGRSIPIKRVVDEHIEGEVWSYNEKTKVCEPKKIIDWHYNGDCDDAADFICITSRNYSKSIEPIVVTVTTSHKLLLNNDKWAEAGDLIIGDVLKNNHDTKSVITNISILDHTRDTCLGKYDISVADNESYAVGGRVSGVIVHNSPETTPGGRAIKFYSSVRINIKRKGAFKAGDITIGAETIAKVIKNKCARPFTEAEFVICFGDESHRVYGVDGNLSLIEIGLAKKVLTSNGSHVRFGDVILGNGKLKASQALSDPILYSEIYSMIFKS